MRADERRSSRLNAKDVGQRKAVADPNRDLLRRQMLEVVENQLRDNDPPETRATLDRLVAEGRSTSEAKRLIACVVVAEMFLMLKSKQSYDRDRFVAGLRGLPELPE